VVDKAALEQVFSEYFSFPCQTLYRLLSTHHYSSSSGAGTINYLVASVIVDLVTVYLKKGEGRYWCQ
jgi:hypothetical protein